MFSYLLTKKLVNYLHTIQKVSIFALLNYEALNMKKQETIKKQEKITDMKKRMRDIYLAVSWREISRTYFDKSVSWFQQKMYGIDGNGGVGGFTPEEADKLYCALNDLADRIRHAADNIKAPATNAPFN